jgi:intracellular sulfur oxidation DsrE/DsrF family protein
MKNIGDWIELRPMYVVEVVTIGYAAAVVRRAGTDKTMLVSVESLNGKRTVCVE